MTYIKKIRVNLKFTPGKVAYEEVKYAGVTWAFKMCENMKLSIHCNSTSKNNFWQVHNKIVVGYKSLPANQIPSERDPIQIPAFTNGMDVTFGPEKRVVGAKMMLTESQLDMEEEGEQKYIILEIQVLSIKGHSDCPQWRMDPRNSETAHDRELVFKNGVLYVSSQYLSMWSEYFNVIFTGTAFNENNQKSIEMMDVDMDEFAEMLAVIYPSMKAVDDKNIESLLYLADRFIIPSLFSFCSRFLRSSASSTIHIFDKFRWAREFLLNDVYDDCVVELRRINLKETLEKNQLKYDQLLDEEKALIHDAIEKGPTKRCRCDNK